MVTLFAVFAPKAGADHLTDCVQTTDLDAAVKGCSALIADEKLTLLHLLAYTDRARAFAGKHDYDRALADLTHVLTLKPDNESLYLSRGGIYERKGDYKNAISDV